jgi:hypothetical protein
MPSGRQTLRLPGLMFELDSHVAPRLACGLSGLSLRHRAGDRSGVAMPVHSTAFHSWLRHGAGDRSGVAMPVHSTRSRGPIWRRNAYPFHLALQCLSIPLLGVSMPVHSTVHSTYSTSWRCDACPFHLSIPLAMPVHSTYACPFHLFHLALQCLSIPLFHFAMPVHSTYVLGKRPAAKPFSRARWIGHSGLRSASEVTNRLRSKGMYLCVSRTSNKI